MTDLPLTGGCSCGALRYKVHQPPVMIYNCHCTNCQKVSGGAFGMPVTVVESSLEFTQGAPARVEWSSDAGNPRFGWYCSACGSRIANGQVKSNGLLSLRGGTLDDRSWLQPVGDIWTRSAQPWVRFVEGGLRAEQQPTDYAPFIAAFRAQGKFEA